MTRQTLDEYLDETLDAAAKAGVERELRADAGAAQLLAHMKAERAARAVALASYAPSADEARELSGRVLAACEESLAQPVGRIGWRRQLVGIAAAVAVVACAFGLGRMSAPVTAPTNGGGTIAMPTDTGATTPADKTYTVVFVQPGSDPQVHEYNTEDEMQNSIRDFESRQSGTMLAMDQHQPGLF